MINIERPTEIPASLQLQEMQDFLQALATHKDDPERFSKPEKPAGYRNSDVLEAFDVYFYSKCYLTEQKFGSAWSLDIDHYIPYNEQPELVFEWSNLYPAEHQANMMRPRRTPEGGYLDPCHPDDDVETEIMYALVEYGREPRFKASNPENLKAKNTAHLLDLLHNGRQRDEDSKKRTKHLRTLIKQRYDEIMEAIIRWQGSTDPAQKFRAEEQLKVLLSRNASFTMLMRSIDTVQVHVPAAFFD